MGEENNEYSDMGGIFDLKAKDITPDDGFSKKSKKPEDNTMSIDIDNIEIGEEFQTAINIMENTFNHVFITGDAGTGKSTLLKYFMGTTQKRAVVLAPTGVAAVNVGGQTIHSFFKFPPKPLTHSNIPVVDERYRVLYQNVDTIIIDEVSMVRVDLMDAIDKFLRINLYSEEPFAGKQIVMFGDLNQLPPVLGREGEREMILHKYKSQFFFDAEVWGKTEFDGIKLTKVYRQKDKTFIDLLNSIKDNTIDEEGLRKINERKTDKILDNGVITLCSTNSTADHINEMMLSKVQGEEYTLRGQITGYFNTKYCNVEENINVRIGCRIMLMNNHPEKVWHNGTIAVLRKVNLQAGKITIEVNNKLYEMEKNEYEYSRYSYDRTKEDVKSEVQGTFVQFPIRVAYGITIHKSQGKTFDALNIDIGAGAFAHGQLYVALSRCTTLEGISLSRFIGKSDIIIDNRVLDFYKELGISNETQEKLKQLENGTKPNDLNDDLPF